MSAEVVTPHAVRWVGCMLFAGLSLFQMSELE
jgi:hypothetical protein